MKMRTYIKSNIIVLLICVLSMFVLMSGYRAAAAGIPKLGTEKITGLKLNKTKKIRIRSNGAAKIISVLWQIKGNSASITKTDKNGAVVKGIKTGKSVVRATVRYKKNSKAKADRKVLKCTVTVVKNAKNGSSTDNKDNSPKDTVKEGLIYVGIINSNSYLSGYRYANVTDIENMFTEENGYYAKLAYTDKNDEQKKYAKEFIDDGVKYLLIAAADTSGWDSVLKRARKKGVKVIIFDSEIDAGSGLYDVSVLKDYNKQGENAVNWLKSQNLNEYRIVHIQGTKNATRKGRSNPLTKACKANGWTVVERQTAGWNAERAKQVVQEVIDRGERFNVIYAENDDMAKGAAAALDKAGISHGLGKDVIIISFDANKWALEEVKSGRWNYEVQDNPFYASCMDDIIKRLEKGETITDKNISIDETGFDAATITDEEVLKYGI